MNDSSAKHRGRSRRAPGLSGGVWVILGLLLFLPGAALSRLGTSLDWRWVVGGSLAISVLTFFAYRSDKRRAEAGAWRIPESALHLAALLGGWPGGFLAQRLFRHKTAKASFQVIFWMIVLIHQYIAADSLLGWRFTRDVLQALGVLTG